VLEAENGALTVAGEDGCEERAGDIEVCADELELAGEPGRRNPIPDKEVCLGRDTVECSDRSLWMTSLFAFSSTGKFLKVNDPNVSNPEGSLSRLVRFSRTCGRIWRGIAFDLLGKDASFFRFSEGTSVPPGNMLAYSDEPFSSTCSSVNVCKVAPRSSK